MQTILNCKMKIEYGHWVQSIGWLVGSCNDDDRRCLTFLPSSHIHAFQLQLVFYVHRNLCGFIDMLLQLIVKAEKKKRNGSTRIFDGFDCNLVLLLFRSVTFKIYTHIHTCLSYARTHLSAVPHKSVIDYPQVLEMPFISNCVNVVFSRGQVNRISLVHLLLSLFVWLFVQLVGCC